MQGVGFRVQGAGFRVQGSGCRVECAGGAPSLGELLGLVGDLSARSRFSC